MTKNIVGTKELVAKMGAWQEVLGFPATHKAYSDLYPHHPQAEPGLQSMTGAWEWQPAWATGGLMNNIEGDATETPGEVYNNAPVKAVTPMPNSRSYLGLSKNGLLLYKSSQGAPWKRAPNSNAFVTGESQRDTFALNNIGFLSDGKLIGSPRHQLPKGRWSSQERLVLIKMPGSVWPYPDPDALPPSWTGMLKSDGSIVGGGRVGGDPIIS